MAAKKFQEFVKGKMISPNVGPIHFNPNDDIDQTAINITNYRKLSDKTSPFETDLFKEQQIQESDDSIHTPSSTKSSPGSKPKWGTQLTDVKKNINNAMEDAYSAFNTLIKGDGKSPTDMDSSMMRPSKTMGNIEKMEIMDDIIESSSMNKSVDNISQRTDNNSQPISENDIPSVVQSDPDCVDFKWFTTPKNEINRKLKKNVPEKNMALPKKIQQSFIENYQFPRSRFSTNKDTKKFEKGIKWQLFTGVLILLISLVFLSMKLFFGFLLGAGSCYLLLLYCGVIDYNPQNDVVSLPRLRDLKSPVIPHIEENNHNDFDFYASEHSNYSCWVNMIGMYDHNTYNINQCQVVHLDIEEKLLRIRRPKKKIAHRAKWKEGHYYGLTFSAEVVIELENVKIDLLPKGLVHKRLWSKKYPICIGFPKCLGECISDMSLSDILSSKSQEIYFFSRTCRDKEELFRRLLNACSNKAVDFNMWNIVEQYLTIPTDLVEGTKHNSNLKSTPIRNLKLPLNGSEIENDNKKVTYHHHNKEDEEGNEPSIETLRWKPENTIPEIAEYIKYMSKFMPSDLFLLTAKVMHLDINYVTCQPELLCINAFLGRLFWDFLRGSHWVDLINKKIQCKLKKIHLPQFMDELTVVDIHLGKEIPLIRKFGRPYLDSRGMWFDADIAYMGGFSMILETKVNLFNLRNQVKKYQLDDDKKSTEPSTINNDLSEEKLEQDIDIQRLRCQSNAAYVDKTAAFISSEEDSAESSSYSEDSGDEGPKHDNPWLDDNKVATTGPQTTVAGGGSSKRLIRWVDKIARSPYFIKAVDNKYVQRGMEMVSNTKLMLQVELHNISGTLAINIPPPPSDRVWYGFRPSPIIRLSAKPKVGQKEISITKITDFIEKKLILEFQRLLVLPNMDDVPLPLLVNGSLENYISNFQ